MMLRRRTLVCALAGFTVLTCLASVRWFTVSTSAETEKITYSSREQPASTAYVDLSGVAKMSSRRLALRTACSEDEALEDLVNNPTKLNNLLVDDKNHVLYCYVPKVACTNWKRVMMMLIGSSNATDPRDIPSDSVHRKHVFVKLSELTHEGIRRRLLTYRKFLFVRHPVERVISAFKNKFEKNYTSSAYFKKRYGPKIMRKYRHGAARNTISASGQGVKFAEFASYLIDSEENQFNEHWTPASILCHPCSVGYDFIGKYETLAEDSEFILRQVGAPASLHFPTVVPSKTSKVIDDYWGTLSESQQRDLIKVYEDDFRIFGYHFGTLI